MLNRKTRSNGARRGSSKELNENDTPIFNRPTLSLFLVLQSFHMGFQESLKRRRQLIRSVPALNPLFKLLENVVWQTALHHVTPQ